MASVLDMRARNRRTGIVVFGIVAGMIALSFASVPLYRLFCQVTGFGGPAAPVVVQARAGTSEGGAVFPVRMIDVRMNTDVDSRLPWTFRPIDRSVTVAVGQDGMTSFEARNDSAKPITGTAVFNVLPEKAGKYFHKTQCFCFGEQTLAPGQVVQMPVLFYIDPEMMKDPNMEDVESMTLSYTFYETGTPALDRALDQISQLPTP